jgi:RimJ/RimL family protein N-acetyltransferase
VDVGLRGLVNADLDQLFLWEQDPAAVALAAFTRADPSDRNAFDEHYQRVRNDPEVTLRAITCDGTLAGMIGSFVMQGEREVTYWVDPSRWGLGIASAALDAFVHEEAVRPLFARVAEHNGGSATVLLRAGFVRVASETSYAEGVARSVVEHIFRLGA